MLEWEEDVVVKMGMQNPLFASQVVFVGRFFDVESYTIKMTLRRKSNFCERSRPAPILNFNE